MKRILTIVLPVVSALCCSAQDATLQGTVTDVITGEAGVYDIAPLAAHYKLTHIFAISSSANFGSPADIAVRATGLPLAEFSWSAIHPQPTPGNLAIDPHLSDGDIVRQLDTWITHQPHAVEINR